MSPATHKVYIGTFVVLTLSALLFLIFQSQGYYGTALEERFYHDQHKWLKPSGAMGHGLGIVGTLMIIVGVFSYMARKRIRRFSRIGVLKYWLEFHIFLCVLGPILVLFHTAFKFGGIVSISFWSMVIVVLSGVIGRFIYLQIPRTIQGRELTMNEIQDLRVDLDHIFQEKYQISDEDRQLILESASSRSDNSYKGLSGMIKKYSKDRETLKNVRAILIKNNLRRSDVRASLKLIKNELSLANKIGRLEYMQKLFAYWHVAHLPFALVMLVIMIIHVGVTLAFGYRWIF